MSAAMAYLLAAGRVHQQTGRPTANLSSRIAKLHANIVSASFYCLRARRGFAADWNNHLTRRSAFNVADHFPPDQDYSIEVSDPKTTTTNATTS